MLFRYLEFGIWNFFQRIINFLRVFVLYWWGFYGVVAIWWPLCQLKELKSVMAALIEWNQINFQEIGTGPLDSIVFAVVVVVV